MVFFENILNKIPGLNGIYTNFYEVAYPVYVISRIFGYLPFTIEYNAKHKIQRLFVSSKDLVRFVLALAVITFCVYVCFWKKIVLQPKSSTISHGTWIIMVSGLISTAFALIMDMVNRRSLGIALKTICQIDEEVAIFEKCSLLLSTYSILMRFIFFKF